jgi:hypothetical protein
LSVIDRDGNADDGEVDAVRGLTGAGGRASSGEPTSVTVTVAVGSRASVARDREVRRGPHDDCDDDEGRCGTYGRSGATDERGGFKAVARSAEVATA